jgi:uncharacterized coiled-coil protein SlyX
VDRIQIKLTAKERDLILDHVLILDDEILEPIKLCEMKRHNFVLEYSIDDLESLLESVAAQANHSENKKMEQKLDRLYEKLNDIFESKID